MSVLEGSSAYSVERCRPSMCQPARSTRPASAPVGRRGQAPGREPSLAQLSSVSRMERLWAAGTELEDMLPPLSMHGNAHVHVEQIRSAHRPSSAMADGRTTTLAASIATSTAHRFRQQRPASVAPCGFHCGSETRRRPPSSARGSLSRKSMEEGEECSAPHGVLGSRSRRSEVEELRVLEKKRACSKDIQSHRGEPRPPGEPRQSSRAFADKSHSTKQWGGYNLVVIPPSRSRRTEVEELRKTRSQSLGGQPWKITGACATTIRAPCLSRTRGSTTSGLFSDVQCLSACESEISFMKSQGRTWRPWSASTSRAHSLRSRRSGTTSETSSHATPNLSQELQEVDRRLPHEFLDSDSDEEVSNHQCLGDAGTGIRLCALRGGA